MKMKIKRTALMLLALMLPVTACAENFVGMPNPWVETTADAVMQGIGIAFNAPEGAENVLYLYLENENLYEMQFDWEGLSFVTRVEPAEAFTDISSIYCDWEIEDACKIGESDGKCCRVNGEEGTTDLCMWYDTESGLMYSLSTTAADLDGFDIEAVAEAIYLTK